MSREKSRRNSNIFDLWLAQGHSYEQIRKKYGFKSEKSVYTIVQREKKRRFFVKEKSHR